MHRSILKLLLVVVWLAILLTPPLVFINRSTPETFSHLGTIFPFFGLIAFTLVWSQIMLGSFMRPLEKLFPNIFPFHIAQGLTALGFAFLHPILLVGSFYPDQLNQYFEYHFIPASMKGYVYLGQASTILLLIGVAAGLLRNWPPLKKSWHWFHLVHYVVFFFIFFHSWNLGSDLQTSALLRGLWIFFFVTVVIGILYRRGYIVMKEGLIKATS